MRKVIINEQLSLDGVMQGARFLCLNCVWVS
jgi:hypothetical protein